MSKNILIQNLNEKQIQFDRDNGITMVSPNNWQSSKHSFFGFSTCRALRNSIKKKIAGQKAAEKILNKTA